MLKKANDNRERKYEWVNKWANMTGERARIDAKANNTYIVYEKEGKIVKEYPNGRVYPLGRDDSV